MEFYCRTGKASLKGWESDQSCLGQRWGWEGRDWEKAQGIWGEVVMERLFIFIEVLVTQVCTLEKTLNCIVCKLYLNFKN